MVKRFIISAFEAEVLGSNPSRSANEPKFRVILWRKCPKYYLFVLYGGCDGMVDIRGCDPRFEGSSPSSHPEMLS